MSSTWGVFRLAPWVCLFASTVSLAGDPRSGECRNVLPSCCVASCDAVCAWPRSGLLSRGLLPLNRVWNRAPAQCRIVAAPLESRTYATPEVKTDVRVAQLGTSVLGNSIVAHYFGSVGRKTLIFAAIHGDEPTTAFVGNRLVEHLRSQHQAYARRQVAVVPVANPDGLARQTRTNAREIDLNRNFPAKNFEVRAKNRYFGGEQPASEPETQILIRLIEEWRPEQIITLHSIARGRHGNNFDGPGESVARLLAEHNQYKVLPTIGYPTPGSFGSWAGIDLQIPTVTLEFPRDATGETCWQENRDALLAAIRAECSSARNNQPESQ